MFAWLGGQIFADTNNSKFISMSAPGIVSPGQKFTIKVTYQNTGTRVWKTGGNTPHRLGSQNPQDNNRWGLGRVELPVNQVVRGQKVTFTFTATAPMAIGSYNCQWRMVQERVQWFGQYTRNQVIKVVGPKNNAQFIWQSVPARVNPGQTFKVKLRFKNNGTTVWKPNGNKSWWLGSENPRDNFIWGANRGGSVKTIVNKGGTYTFEFNVKAPNKKGTYNFQWMMLQNAVEWFGQKSPNLRIVVGPYVDNSQFISQTAPAYVPPGRNFSIKLKYKNTGTTIWKKGIYCLTSENPPGNTTWGTNRIELPYDVNPGATVTIVGNLKAPIAEGVYKSQWRLSKGGSHRFGQISNTKNISVYHIYDSYGRAIFPPNSLQPGENFSIEYAFTNTGTIDWFGVWLNVSGGGIYGSPGVYAPVGGTDYVRVSGRAPNYNTTLLITAQLNGPRGYFGDIVYLNIPVRATSAKTTVIANNSDDILDVQKLEVTPNPAYDILTIKLPEIKDKYVVKLIDLTGKVVLEESTKNKDLLELNVTELKRGMYILLVENESETYKEKIVLK